MKIIKIILLSIVVSLFSSLKAAVPTWSINPNAYQYNMSVTATAKFNCNESTNPNNMMGAFIGGNLAGFANVNTSINGSMYAYVTVYSNVAGGDTVTFKMYDSVNDTLLDSKYTTVFQENASVGNAAAPFVQKTDYELREITIDTDTIFEYNLTGDSVVMFRVENENMEFEIVDFTFINDATGIDNSYFSFVDSFLVMAQNVDFLNKDFYNIHIQATNSRGCSMDTSLVITVKNTNVPPTGINPNPTNIDENQIGGTLVSTLIPIDVSPSDVHVFEITGDTANFPDNIFFSIVGDSLLSTTNFNYEMQNVYTLQIKVTDNLLGYYIDTIIVNINDLVEFTGFMEDPANVDENQISGTFVSTLTPIALLATDTHTYVLSANVSFPDNSSFVLLGDSLMSTTDFNYEIQSQYNLLFEVTDKFGTVYLDTFVVDINDLVEFTDFMENPAYIDENQYPGAFVTALTPIAILATDTHTYVLSTDTVNFPDNNAFTLTNDTILSNQSFDFELKNQYTLLIEVTDKFGTVYLDTFTVYINGLIEFTDFVDNPVDFDENQDGGLLVTQFVPLGVLPIDTHTYILSADLVNFPDNNAFSITTDSLMSNWNYDFETQSIYTLLIEVRDKFGTLYLDTFIVNINDRVEFTNFIENPTSFDENQDGGLLVTTLTPIAILATDTHTYILSTDLVNFPDNNAFALNTDSLISNWNYDFETQSVYTLLIEVRDRFDTMYLDTFIVNINDRVEFTDFIENPTSFDENQDGGLLVTTLTPIAILATDTHTYTLSADLVNFPDNNAFALNTDSLISNWNYDFETQSVYTLLIEVRDRFDTMYLDTFIVNINDKVEFTEFEENPVYIDENTGPEILISSLTPIAILTTDIHTYTLSADTTNFPDNNMFWIQTDSLINKYNFDYEIQEEYILLIEVRDRFDTMYLDTFIVNINDIDEFEYFEEDPIYFDENQIVGTMVSVLVPVGSLFGEELTYSLSTDTIYFSDNSAFSIVEDELLSAEVYNYETQNEYNLLVEIRNEFGTLYLDTVLVIINDLIEFDDLKVTNFVTPNEDGKNDYFAIPNPELFSDYTLRIFNDNGNEVYLQEGDYNNDWNGLTTSGEELPSATYYYTFIQKGQELNNFVGKVTILRTSKF